MSEDRYEELMERRQALHRFWMDNVLPRLKDRYGPEPGLAWGIGPILTRAGMLYMRVWVEGIGYAYDIYAERDRPIRVMVNEGARDLDLI